MGAYIKYKTARDQCVMHRAVCDEAIKALTTKGAFRKDLVLKRAGAVAVAESINWHFIQRMIEEEFGEYCLMPLAQSFWSKDMDEEQKRERPEKFLATGHGKKTAGFGLVSADNGDLALRFLEQKASVAKGTEKAKVKAVKAVKSSNPKLASRIDSAIAASAGDPT